MGGGIGVRYVIAWLLGVPGTLALFWVLIHALP